MKISFLAKFLCSMFLSASLSVAQNTLWVKVIFYDFHANRSCPEFEADNDYWRVEKNMVLADRMEYYRENADFFGFDSIGKPIYNPANIRHSRYIKYWFRPWEVAAKGDFTIPNYRNPDGSWRYDGRPGNPEIITVNHDTAFINKVIYDSLPFTYAGNDMYTFVRRKPDYFFWIDNKGYGPEKNITTDKGTHNYGFTMEMHRKFQMKRGLTFEFAGDDDVWVFIDGKLVMDLGGIHSEDTSTVRLDDIPWLVPEQVYTFSLFYAERHTTESNISIFTNIISSIPQTLVLNVQDDTIAAGDSIDITAQIFDQRDSLRHDLMSLVEWNIVNPVTPGDKILSAKGATTTFTGTQAYHTARIAAVYIDEKGKPLTDTANIYIKPGPAAQVVIERVSESQLLQNDVTGRQNFNIQADPLSIITMDGDDDQRYVYAVVRDRFGNYVRLATNASWTSTKPDSASVTPTSGKKWEALIDRASGAKGTLKIIAAETNLVSDTVELQMQSGYITGLRLVDKNGSVITTIHIDTDEEQYVKVQATWSNRPADQWIDVSGAWSMTPSIPSANALPSGMAGDWTFSPKEPGTATLTVSAGTYDVSVPVQVDIAPPSRITIDILTPADSLIAGYPIRLELRIYNDDGLVPQEFCAPAAYTDVIGRGGSDRPRPYIIINNGTGTDTLYYGETADQCFMNGIDTVTTRIFYAPFNYRDSLHQISIDFDGLKDQTTKFRLYPAPIAELRLEHYDGSPMPDDTTIAHPDGALSIYAVAYDRYYNKIGAEVSTWNFTEGLHENEITQGPQIYYSANQVTNDEQGIIIATSTTNTDIKDSIRLYIRGPRTKLVAALTLDRNANGYLDAIKLTFDKKTAFPTGYDVSKIVLRAYENGTNTYFTVNRIEPAAGDSSTEFILYLDENTSQKTGQTGWLPLLSIDDIDGVETIKNFECTDGAPPVVWEVRKKVNAAGDRTKDIVTVTFSETVFAADGSPLSGFTSPAIIFYVWIVDNGDTVKVDSMFAGIDAITEVSGKYVRFAMINGADLNGNHFVNFIIDPAAVADKAGNTPVEYNQKVRVIVEGDIGKIHIGPNPMYPVFKHFEPQLTHHNPQEAYQWAKNDGGAVMVAEVYLADTAAQNFKVRASMMVFDAVGNLAYSKTSGDDVIPADWRKDPWNNENRQLVFYWNGITNDNRKAAPGIYRVVIYLDSESRQEKFLGNVGIGR